MAGGASWGLFPALLPAASVVTSLTERENFSALPWGARAAGRARPRAVVLPEPRGSVPQERENSATP